MSGKKRRRGVSAGTILMLILTAVVLGSTFYIFAKLTNGFRFG